MADDQIQDLRCDISEIELLPSATMPVADLPLPAAQEAPLEVEHKPVAAQTPAVAQRAARARSRKPRCEDCFFNQNMLCALVDKKPCPTFRPAHPDGLRPPQQLAFVFRQDRRPANAMFEFTRA